MLRAIVNIDVRIPLPDGATEDEISNIISNYEFQDDYVEDTISLVKIEDEG